MSKEQLRVCKASETSGGSEMHAPEEVPMNSRRGFLRNVIAGSIGISTLLCGAETPLSAMSDQQGKARGLQLSGKSIKIDRVETIRVVVPYKPGAVFSEDAIDLDPFWKYHQKGNPEAPKTIVKLHADNGLVGIGETSRGISRESAARNSAYLTGRDILTLDLWDISLGMPDSSSSDGFEIAIYDLMGKSFGVPVHYLLGGLRQEKVAVSYWTAQRNERDLVAIAEKASELGFQHLKFKAHTATPVDQLVRAVVKATPNLTLGVDFNCRFPDPGSFMPMGKRLEGFPLVVEDPLPGRMEWWTELRQRLDINFALTPGWVIPRTQLEEPESDERVLGDPDGLGIEVLSAIRSGACDTFNLNSGHFRSFVNHSYLAGIAGMPVWHGSGAELGIRDTAYIHAAAATRSCTLPSDTICFLRESDLLLKPFMSSIKNGFIEVPKLPGLGVELDEDALRHYQVE